MMIGDPLHGLHHKLIVIHRDIRRRIDRRELVLCRRRLVMLGFSRHAQFPEFLIQILHISAHPLFDHAEIMILHLLAFRRRRAKESAPRKHQILPPQVQILIHQKIFLLRSDTRRHLCRRSITKEFYNTQCLIAQRLHGPKQRRLFIQRITRIRTERRRNTEDRTAGRFFQKCRRCNIPRRISPGLKSRAETAGGERRGIRLPLDQLFAGKLRNHFAVLVRVGYKRIMLFRRDAGQRLKPV